MVPAHLPKGLEDGEGWLLPYDAAGSQMGVQRAVIKAAAEGQRETLSIHPLDGVSIPSISSFLGHKLREFRDHLAIVLGPLCRCSVTAG